MRRAVIIITLMMLAGMAWGAELKYDTQWKAAIAGTLTRSSIAFLDGIEYAANTGRYQMMGVTTPPVVTKYTTEVVGAEGTIQLVSHCISGNYMYACKAGASGSSTGLFRSADGVTWEVMQASGAIVVYQIYGLSNGDILVARTSGSNVILQYSADGGATLTNCTVSGSTFTYTGSGATTAYPAVWNFYQRPDNGTVIVSEYGDLPDEAPKVYRSTDNGQTFTLVYNYLDHSPAGYVKHSHVCYYHPGTDKWINVFGDNGTVLSGYIITSADDGATWTNFMDRNTRYTQPVSFLDVGDATRLLAGDDADAGLCWFDMTTLDVDPLIADAHDNYTRYCFNLYKYGSLVFADRQSMAELTAASRRAGIYVSNNFEDWIPYYLFRDTEVGVVRFQGVINKQLHFDVKKNDGTFQHYSLSLPKITYYNGICIDPATTNLLNDTSKSSAESNVTGYSAYGGFGTVVQSTEEKLHGTASAKFTVGYNSGAFCRFPSAGNGTDAWYSGRFSVKAASNDNRAGWYISGTGYDNTPVNTAFGISKQRWTSVAAVPWNPHRAAGEQVFYIRSYPSHLGGYLGITGTMTEATESATVLTDSTKSWATNELVGMSVLNVTDSSSSANSCGVITANTGTTLTVSSLAGGSDNKFQANDVYRIMGSVNYFDCGQIELGVCSRWQVGGTARTHEKLTVTYAYPDTWSQVFLFCPEQKSDCQANLGNQYVLTIYNDVTGSSENCICVYYNPSDYKFYLQTLNGGSSATTATTNTYKYLKDQPIYIAVRYNGSRLLFSVACGDVWEHVTNIAAFPWCADLVAYKTGRQDDSTVMSMTFINNWIRVGSVDNYTLELCPYTISGTDAKSFLTSY